MNVIDLLSKETHNADLYCFIQNYKQNADKEPTTFSATLQVCHNRGQI